MKYRQALPLASFCHEGSLQLQRTSLILKTSLSLWTKHMGNPNPKTEQLGKNYSAWKNSKTVAVRVPEKFKDEILAFARELDSKNSPIQDKAK